MSENNITEIQQIDQSGLSLRNKYIHLKRILERSCKEVTMSESLQFPSLFSRLVFISQKYNLPKFLEWRLQNIRIKTNFLQRNENNLVSPDQYHRAKESLIDFLLFLKGDKKEIADNPDDEDTSELLSLNRIRVQLLEIDKENELLVCQSDLIAAPLKVRYNVSTINEIFNSIIERLWIGAQLNLIGAVIDASGYYVPKMFVLEPDYLIDASSMAECFQSYGNSHLHYFRRKFEPNANSHYILLGNLANFFLDELIYAEDAENLAFEEVFQKSFRLMSFEYTSCKEIAENIAFRDFMAKAERHFNNIKRVVLNDMPANGFDIHACTLEPSFFCEKYGFQGRLDLLQLSDGRSDVDRIIELKSGKPPYPRENVTKIASNHEAQTIIYRLMIQSVFNKDARHVYPTILYSSADNPGENLRYAAVYQQLEKEIINIRNLIVATEHDLYIGDEDTAQAAFDELFDLDNYGRVPQFFIDKLFELKKILDDSSSLEKAYFYRYISFVTRELYLQKTGDEGFDSAMSVSALWNTSFEERKEALDLITNLKIEEIDEGGRDMSIRFRRDETTNCVNFRVGEICILYPRQKETDTALTNQILKGTVVEISASHALLRFRYKQRNLNFFSRYKYWTVEHDKLDHAYNGMFKSLFAFLSAPKHKKELLLGLCTSASDYPDQVAVELNKEEKQETVIDKALSAKDYFLIVGPPGTGKTSIFARQLIEKYYANESTNILVMAYTNRAVDELCASISQAFCEDESVCEYIRIGSELSCGENYRHRLLQNISHQAKNRKELLQTIDNTRVFVGTLASIMGKPELFDLKKFDVAIIDEASQILEPQIIGLLPLFDKFIMIGDHKQLSTITLQDEYKSKVVNEELNWIELYDCRESLFERLFRVCQKQGWNHAYDTLTYHGRMHEEIASLVNRNFYDNLLKIATDRQSLPLCYPKYNSSDKFQSLIATKRIAFIPARIIDDTNASNKINVAEADLVVSLAKSLLELYKQNGIPFDAQKTLGIITPYRNQIALIKQKLEETGMPEFADIMVDTVERYQGSQRDVIIFSFCFNRAYQLRYFINMNLDGNVDRKLNVALTRAREQLFLIGNDLILSQNLIYREILQKIT